MFARRPEVHSLEFPWYEHTTGPVYEPEYLDPDYVMPRNMWETMYRGDDYGGHNIPYPSPTPPAPHMAYQQDAFVDIVKFFDNMSKGIYDGDLGGYDMEPHGLAGWSADKAFKGDILMRWVPDLDLSTITAGIADASKDAAYAAVQDFGNIKARVDSNVAIDLHADVLSKTEAYSPFRRTDDVNAKAEAYNPFSRSTDNFNAKSET